jgi:small-conductance mechanosensitive channel
MAQHGLKAPEDYMPILLRIIMLFCALVFPLYSQTSRQIEGVAGSGIWKPIFAFGLLVAFLAATGQLARYGKKKATALVFSKMPKFSLGQIPLFGPNSISVVLGLSIRILNYLVAILAIYLCITYILSTFPDTHSWGAALEIGLETLLLNMGIGILHSLPGLFAIAAIVLAARGLTFLINRIFKSIELGESAIPWIYKEAAAPTRRIAVALLWVFAVVLAYPHIPGNESIAFKSIGVFIGLLVSFGSAGMVNQAMNGLAIMYSRTFKRGDYVKIGEIEGTVSEVTMLATKLLTIRQEEVAVPNSLAIAQTIYNYTRAASKSGVGLSTSVELCYDAPWRLVHALLKSAAEKTNGLASDPAPYVIQESLGNSGVKYTLVAQMAAEAKMREFVKTELHQNIQDELNKHGIEMTTPTFVKAGAPAAIPEEKWDGGAGDGGKAKD